MPLESRRRVIAWYQLAIAVLVLGWWTASLAGGDVEEVEAGQIDIWFHVAAELTMAMLLIAGAWLLLRHRIGFGTVVSGFGLGALLYSVINAAGHSAEMGEWTAVALFGVVAVTAVVAMLGLALTIETVPDRAVDRVIERLSAT